MTYKYFSGLKYTLANEDTALELALVKKFSPQVIVTVTGSGSRAIPLVVSHCKKLFCLDINQAQLFLCELRLRSYLDLTHEEFLRFWGYQAFDFRSELFKKLKLEPVTADYFLEVFQTNFWSPLLYLGSWERTFKTFSSVAKVLLGEKRLKLFESKNIEEQRIFYAKTFPKFRWYLLLKILGNKAVFNTLLYKGSFVKKNINESYFDFYKQRFDHLFNNTLASENFFLQLCLLGEIKFSQAWPVEATFENFNSIKQALKHCKSELVLASCVDFLENYNSDNKVDFVSLSDVPSYFDDELLNSYLQKIRPALAMNAIVVVRYYLRLPTNPDLTGFKNITEQFTDLIQQEKVGVYTITILQKIVE